MTSLQPIERDRDGLGLLAPASFGMDGAEGTGRLLGNLPGTSVWCGYLTVGRGLGGKQPDSLTNLDRVSFVPVLAGAALDGAGKLNLDESMSLKLIVFQPANVAVCRQGSAGEATQHVQRSGRLSPVDTGERDDPSALVDGTAESEECGRQHFFTVGGVLVAEDPQHGIQIPVNPFQGVGLWIVGRGESKPKKVTSIVYVQN